MIERRNARRSKLAARALCLPLIPSLGRIHTMCKLSQTHSDSRVRSREPRHAAEASAFRNGTAASWTNAHQTEIIRSKGAVADAGRFNKTLVPPEALARR